MAVSLIQGLYPRVCFVINVFVCDYMYRPFATRSEDHDHHMTVFPSLRPAGRHEVITLKVTSCCNGMEN